jgi:hypothetical protein
MLGKHSSHLIIKQISEIENKIVTIQTLCKQYSIPLKCDTSKYTKSLNKLRTELNLPTTTVGIKPQATLLVTAMQQQTLQSIQDDVNTIFAGLQEDIKKTVAVQQRKSASKITSNKAQIPSNKKQLKQKTVQEPDEVISTREQTEAKIELEMPLENFELQRQESDSNNLQTELQKAKQKEKQQLSLEEKTDQKNPVLVLLQGLITSTTDQDKLLSAWDSYTKDKSHLATIKKDDITKLPSSFWAILWNYLLACFGNEKAKIKQDFLDFKTLIESGQCKNKKLLSTN